MSKHNETLAEIMEEMRGMGNYQRYSGDHAHALADRIEAAWKRAEQTYLDQIRDAVNQWGHEKYKAEHAPVGNSVALREALEYASRVLAKWRQDAPFSAWNEYGEAIDRCRAALAAPPRQCDVGTAEEQKERLKAFCMKHGCDKLGNPRCEADND